MNNQTRGAAPGTLTALFDSGLCVVGASKVNQNNQHFYCTGYSGQLLAASTGDLPGRLVLSDFECDDKKDPDPDPK